MDYLDDTGLHIDALEDRIDAVCSLFRALIAPNLDLSADQPSGQLVRIPSERTQNALELLREVYSSWDPDNAQGQALTALSLITGTQRRSATNGLVTLTVNLDGGTTLPAGSIAAVTGEPTNRWITTVDVVAPAGPAADYPVIASAEDTGPIQALAGTITVIATPVAGWNTVTNAADAQEGTAEETDTALRLRREIELFLGGSTTVDAIRADLVNMTGMVEASVIENDNDVVVDGIPAHAFEAVIYDGVIPAVLDVDIAETIFLAKASGIRASGTTTIAHVDDQGNTHQIGFTRAAQQRILIEVTIDTDADYLGDAALQTYIETQGTASHGVGDDVYMAAVSAWCMAFTGVVNVTLVRLAIWPAAVAAADVTITNRQIATFDSADVVVL